MCLIDILLKINLEDFSANIISQIRRYRKAKYTLRALFFLKRNVSADIVIFCFSKYPAMLNSRTYNREIYALIMVTT